MDIQTILKQQLPQIVELARLAPSVHNTQPWLVSSEGNIITVIVDRSHCLTQGDPTGRQTTLSIGIFCEALKIAAENQGFDVENVRQLPEGGQLVVASYSGEAPSEVQQAAELLRQRHSDRSIYKPVTLDTPAIAAIESAAQTPEVTIHLTTDRAIILKVAELTSKGIGVALSSPDFRQELSRYLVLPWSHKRRGIAVKSLYISPAIAYTEPWLLRLGIGLGAEAKLERQRWESASAIVAITGDGDFAKYWFEAGRAYFRASLEIAGFGLAQATSAAIVEASNYHEDIEELLGTKQRILALLRIGQGSPKHHYSPRVSAPELLRETSTSS